MKWKHRLPALLLSIGAAASQAQIQAPLRIGVTAGVTVDSIEAAAVEARKQGLEVRVIEFSDFTTPNVALEAGDLDANYFQHQAFLDNAIKERGYKLRSVAIGVVSNIGLYSTKYSRLEEVKDGARVAIANDPSNQARALGLLAQAGLIQLRAGAGPLPRLDDIAANPRRLKFIEVDGIQIVRSLDDVELAPSLPHGLVRSGRGELADKALFYAKGEPAYWAVQFVTRRNNADDPRLRQFIKIYHESPAVRTAIRGAYANNDNLYGLPWIKP